MGSSRISTIFSSQNDAKFGRLVRNAKLGRVENGKKNVVDFLQFFVHKCSIFEYNEYKFH